MDFPRSEKSSFWENLTKRRKKRETKKRIRVLSRLERERDDENSSR